MVKRNNLQLKNVGMLQRTSDDRIYVRGLIKAVASTINANINMIYYRIKDIKIEGNTLPLRIIIEVEVERGEQYGS